MSDGVGQSAIPVYDLRGLNCPLPVLKARKRLSDMAVGTQLWVETTDPLAVIDLPHFAVRQAMRWLQRRVFRVATGF